MIAYTQTGLRVSIADGSPDERRDYLIKALAASMRWYAHNPDKRDDDHDYAAQISLLMQELVDVDNN